MQRRAFLELGGMGAALVIARPTLATLAAGAAESSQGIVDAAKSRIEKYRKGEGTVTVLDQAGKPVKGARVAVEQLAHDFLFGCNIFMFGKCGDPDLEEQYRSRFAAVMNYATLGFYWASYEFERGHPGYGYTDQVLEWTSKHGIRCKGHPLVWDHPAGSPRWLPADDEELKRLSNERVREIIRRYQGQIDVWDVVNEATHIPEHLNKTRMAEWAARIGSAEYVSQHLRLARATNPRATLIVNDYRLDASYFKLLEQQRSAAPLLFDVVGLQSHMHGGVWKAAKVWDSCERFGKLGLPLHFTETTLVSGPRTGRGENNWGGTTAEGEARQAEATAQFYTLVFSHPAVRALTWWDFSDRGAWQRAAAGWLRRDMSAKPVYDRLRSMIKEQWWTKEEKTSDSKGVCGFRAFYGRYRVRVTLPNGKAIEKEVNWRPQERRDLEIML